jgi:hypothetical protein
MKVFNLQEKINPITVNLLPLLPGHTATYAATNSADPYVQKFRHSCVAIADPQAHPMHP